MKPDYRIELDGNIIGHSKLETGDPPMGVASGRVNFEGVSSPSLLFHESCRNAGIEINDYDPSLGLIDTQLIPNLRVYRADGLEICGELGASITGFDDDGFYITILGIPHPFYSGEFPELCEAYDKQFS